MDCKICRDIQEASCVFYEDEEMIVMTRRNEEVVLFKGHDKPHYNTVVKAVNVAMDKFGRTVELSKPQPLDKHWVCVVGVI